MKKIILRLIILGLVLICFFIMIPNETVNNLDPCNGLLTQEQQDIIFKQIKQFPNKTQIAVSFLSGDSCFFFGVIKHNDTVSEIDNKLSLFEIGSITKVFTATLLSDFILDSTLTLSRNINDDLGFKLNNDTHISYRALANHTSGLPRRPSGLFLSAVKSPLNPYRHYSTDKLDKYLKEKLVLSKEAGSHYKYSNLGIGILGVVLCKVAQSDYETLLHEKIFAKYGLTTTTSVKEEINDNLVAGLGPFGNKTPDWDFASLAACGSIISSVYDLTKFIQAQFDTNNVELNMTRETTYAVDSSLAIGLAWHIVRDKSHADWYWHNGGTGGYRSSVVFDTKNTKGIIVLTNISVAHRKNNLVDYLSFELLKTLNTANTQYKTIDIQ